MLTKIVEREEHGDFFFLRARSWWSVKEKCHGEQHTVCWALYQMDWAFIVSNVLRKKKKLKLYHRNSKLPRFIHWTFRYAKTFFPLRVERWTRATQLLMFPLWFLQNNICQMTIISSKERNRWCSFFKPSLGKTYRGTLWISSEC